ncbi:MAG: hypothetical protein H0V13_06705 [Nocardioidaceae bacterium]|jgi:uncharacterized membrane protein|nr:hypothetical protein [Nocardioidaceae bacterium]
MPVTRPSRSDEFAADSSRAIGGPVGAYARRPRRSSALITVLLITTVAMSFGVLSKNACAAGAWWEGNQAYANVCESELPQSYIDLGLAEQVPPLGEDAGRYPGPAVSVPTAVVSYVVARMSQAAFGVQDPVDRDDSPVADVAVDPAVQAEAVEFTAVAAVLLALAALACAGLLVLTHRHRPWDALGFAAAPVLVLSGLIGWDLLPAACLCAALWSWSRRRLLLTGVLLGTGAAFSGFPSVVLVVLVLLSLRAGRGACVLPTVAGALLAWVGINVSAALLGPAGWGSYWSDRIQSAPGTGSLWEVVAAWGWQADAILANQVLGIGSLVVLVVTGWLAFSTARRPRVTQLAFLAVAGMLLLVKDAPPQTALWLLPLAVLARPHWRDLLIWQACEVVYFLAWHWHLGGFTLGGGTSQDEVYVLAILLRVAGIGWLVAMVIRDIRAPWQDPVRADGTVDDPAGGVLDGVQDVRERRILS